MDTPSAGPARRPRLFLIECFAATRAAVAEIERRAARLREEAGPAGCVDYLGGLALPDDEQLLLIVRGHSAEAVSAACGRARLVVDRLSEIRITGAIRAELSPDSCPPPRLADRVAGCRR